MDLHGYVIGKCLRFEILVTLTLFSRSACYCTLDPQNNEPQGLMSCKTRTGTNKFFFFFFRNKQILPEYFVYW